MNAKTNTMIDFLLFKKTGDYVQEKSKPRSYFVKQYFAFSKTAKLFHEKWV